MSWVYIELNIIGFFGELRILYVYLSIILISTLYITFYFVSIKHGSWVNGVLFMHWVMSFFLFFQVSTELPVRCLWSCLPLWWEWGMVYLSQPPRTMNKIKGFRRPRNISRVCPKNSASFLIAAHLDLAYTISSELSTQWHWGCLWTMLHHSTCLRCGALHWKCINT